MTGIVVSPLRRIAEMAVRHGCREMLSLLAKGQDFHRPAVIDQAKHMKIGVNDITFAGTGGLIAPQEEHVRGIIGFARNWDRTRPMLIHCWMGVSRSPAAALIAALAVEPDQDDHALARRLRLASPFATPNARLVEFGDEALSRKGRLVDAVRSIGRGADADGNAPFILPLVEDLQHVG
ncbi:tyrosine phosphatase family protein [Sinorhizobium medicae]|uniref:tyrosine phosphatase family protein n=1 Tax=Sinorhizobium medicae TaxID=110321 RepID=UPI000419F663|nr:tyrosine phosphatase family protein [Sinorhizobium medicae]RVQ70882.1 protein tyrosine phosphatase [Sinorhizobium medicae]